ncbi:MAG: protein TolB [Desulfocapsaceae bacterium]|nr:protein TolB [Desulfocapsaceae bacterium]
MKKLLFIYLFCISCFAGSITTCFGQDRVYLEIGSTDVRKINFAVPWFRSRQIGSEPQEFAKNLADTLAKSLKFHGVINIIPTKLYNGSQTTDWKKLGADFAILGIYESSGNSLKLELRLFEVSSDRMILGKSYSGKMAQQNDMLFRFCDSVIEDLTGSNGLASTSIAFVSQGRNTNKQEVFISDILGNNIRQVTRHRNLVVSPRFVPGGNFMTYTSYHSGNQNLYITDLRQSKTTRVLSRRSGMNLAPAWFPDGQNMLLTLSYKGNPDLYLLDKRGKIIKQLTKNGGINVSATISPDGEKAVFVSDRSGSPQLYHMDLKSGRTQRFTYTGTENAEPDWHPTENLIVYSSLRNGVYQICTKSPDRTVDARQLTSELSHHESPAWSPDGNQIIFSKQDGRENTIYGMMKDGTFQRRIFSYPGSQTYPRWAE